MSKLTVAQLYDATKCGTIDCSQCIMNETRYTDKENCIQILAETALKYREMLERLVYYDSHPHCKVCKRSILDGHADNCAVGAVLNGN